MDILKTDEVRINMQENLSVDRPAPTLDEVIYEIDTAVGRIGVAATDEKEAAPILADADTARPTQFILFTLESTFFALPLTKTLEIGHRPEIAPLPNLPNWVLGISNVRGEIISFVNLKAFFGIPSSAIKGESRFAVIYSQDMKVGIVADKTPGILSMDKLNMEIQDSPYRQGEFIKYIKGVTFSNENIVNILDTDKLLSALRITDSEPG